MLLLATVSQKGLSDHNLRERNQIPPLTKWRVHFTLRLFLFSLIKFLRALEFLNHMMLPSRRINIIPVPGSISSPEKVQILRSGIIFTVHQSYGPRDLYP